MIVPSALRPVYWIDNVPAEAASEANVTVQSYGPTLANKLATAAEAVKATSTRPKAVVVNVPIAVVTPFTVKLTAREAAPTTFK
jgi:hypothetical protein